jgi:hypothetical protein
VVGVTSTPVPVVLGRGSALITIVLVSALMLPPAVDVETKLESESAAVEGMPVEDGTDEADPESVTVCPFPAQSLMKPCAAAVFKWIL